MNKKSTLKSIPVERLQRGRYQPRQVFDDEALHELAESIKSAGLLQPIVVRPLEDDRYEIVAGERRWRATQLAGLTEINCLIRSFTDDEAAEAATIENINRVNLNPIEEAQAYQRLVDDFGYIHEEVAAAVGKSRARVTNFLRLLKLDTRIQQWLIEGELTEGHAKILVALQAPWQFELAKQAKEKGWSARKVEQEVKKLKNKTAVDTRDKDPDVERLERELSAHIGCPVDIDFSEGHGKLKIDFYDLDVLQGILEKMGYEN